MAFDLGTAQPVSDTKAPDYAALEKEYKLPSGILSQVRKTESGGDSSAVSEKGAEGDFQFMPATAKQYGVDPKDPHSSARGAAQMLADLSKKYDGDKDKMLAGWNWGQGHLDEEGLKNAPAETRKFTEKVKSGLPKEGGFDLASAKPVSEPEAPAAAPEPAPEAASTPKSLWEKMKGTPAPGTLDESMSGPKKALTAFGGGLIRAGQGIGQMGVEAAEKLGAVKPGSTQKYNEAMAPDVEAMNKLKAGEPWYGPAHVGSFAGEAAPTLAVPGGAAGGILKRAATGALAGGTIGAVQPVAEGESRTGNILAGAATGGVAAGTGAVAGKLANTALGRTPVSEAQKLADTYKVPITLGEATGNNALKKTETLLERAPGPLGLEGYRKKQAEAATDAAKNFLGKYIADPAAADVSEGNRAFVSAQYEGLKDLIKTVPVQEIAPKETRSAANDLIKRYPDVFKKLQDTKTEGLIDSVVSGVGPEANTGGPLSLAAPAAKTMTFDEMWTLRQGLGEKIGQARKLEARGDMDRTAVGQMKKLFSAVSNDLDNWSSSIGKPEIAEQFKAANSAYKDFVVKHDIVQRAYDKAAGTVGAGEMFSPKKFSTALKSIVYKDNALKNFSPAEVDEMTGLANIMQVVKRAGQYAENPPTGNRYGALTVGGLAEGAAYTAGGATAAVKTAGAAAATAGALRFLTSTEMGKRLALSASRLEPGSSAMTKLVNEVMDAAPAIAASAVTQPEDRRTWGGE